MLIARPDRPVKSRSEAIERVRANVRRYAEMNPDESLFGGAGGLRYTLHLILLGGAALALLGLLVAFAVGAGLVWALGLIVASSVLGGIQKLDERMLRRRYKRENEAARIGLGVVVQVNSDLLDPGNVEPRFGGLLVTMDDELIDDALRLREIASSLFEWKEEGGEPPAGLGEIAREVGTERVDIEKRLRVPRELVGNDCTWFLSVLFLPEELPDGYVDRPYWPVLLHEHELELPASVPDKELWWEPETNVFYYEPLAADYESEDEGEDSDAEPTVLEPARPPVPDKDLEPFEVPRPDHDKAHAARQRQRILERLERASRPAIPPPPRLRTALLLAFVATTRLSIFMLLPLVALGLVSIPVVLALGFDIRMHRSMSNLLWIAAVGLVVAYVRAWRARAREQDPAIVLTRSDEPVLYELVDAAARSVGAPDVDVITMTPGAGFNVHEERRDRKRRLYLALEPHDVAGLDLAELTSILLHELAHFGEGHTRQSRRLYQRTRFLYELEDKLAADRWRHVNPIFHALRLFHWIHARLYASISRRQELQADTMAIGVLGPAAFESALPKVIRARIRLNRTLWQHLAPAIESADLGRDVYEDVARKALSAEEALDVKEAFEHRRHAPSQALDHHPTLADRLEHAEQLGAAQPELLELASLAGGPSAYEALLDERRSTYQHRAARALIEAHLGYRRKQIGLRGEMEVPGGRGPAPVVFARRYRFLFLLAGIVGCAISLLLFGLALVVAALDAEFTDGVVPLALINGTIVLVTGVMLRMLYVGLRSDARGLCWVGLLRSNTFSWSEIVGIAWDSDFLRVDFETDGRARSRKVKGKQTERDLLAQVVLEHAPALGWIAWGTGIVGAPEPQTNDASLPARVSQEMGAIVVEGPGSTHIQFYEKMSDYDLLKAFIERRLLPAMEQDPETPVEATALSRS